MQVDMSPEGVTARLKLASELRDLCLLLGKAKIEQPTGKQKKGVKKVRSGRKNSK